MLATMNGHTNGHATGNKFELIERIVNLEAEFLTKRKDRDAESSYAAGESGRMNPVPLGVDPLGTDADYHYRTERNYFLMVERGRAAVRNHPLVEQGIRRLGANLKLGECTLDVDGGDEAVDEDHKAWWKDWSSDAKRCDYEQSRTIQQMVRQSFFSRVADGDIVHLPLQDGSIQTWENHHVRNPWGWKPTNSSQNGIVHGAEIRNGKVVAYWITPHDLTYGQRVSRRSQATRFPVFDEEGNKITWWMGFTHRFQQRRGISRLSPPRDAMNGFDDLNYANIKSALRRALISYLMQSTTQPGPNLPLGGGQLPQAGDRYTTTHGLGLQSIVVEQCGEPAQVFKPPEGYKIDGWNANLPASSFFEQSALLLTMLAVNLDIPLMFLLLDGSLVNFHGGRMTFDQAKLRFIEIQKDEVDGFYSPMYRWKTRQRMTPGSVCFDPAFAAAVARGYNPYKFQFRTPAWPYVKPLEDAAGEDLAVRRNLKSERSVLAARGVDLDENRKEIITDRVGWARLAIQEAIKLRNEFPDAKIDVPRFFRELWYGNEQTGVTLAVSADSSGETKATATSGGSRPQEGDDAA